MAKQLTASRARGSYSPEVTKKAILDTALALFGERGFHATTVQAITEKANLTKGAFYHHFESKEEVLQQIHAEYAGEMVAGMRAVLAEAAHTTPLEQLRRIIINAVVVLGRHRLHVAVFYQEFRFLSGDAYSNIRTLHDEQEAALLDIIARAKAAGEVREEVDQQLLVFAISGMTAWIYQWYNPNGRRPLEEIAGDLADIVLDGVVLR
jgi:AcrR family transcriptional regulator